MQLMQRIIVCLVLCALISSTAPAWGPNRHIDLAELYYSDPLIDDFAEEFDTNVSDVTGGAALLRSR